MTSAPIPLPVIYDDGVYAPILQALLDLMAPDERAGVEEILAMEWRSMREEEAS